MPNTLSDLPQNLWVHYSDDAYSQLMLLCRQSIHSSIYGPELQQVLEGFMLYAEGNEEWEKSYNYQVIKDKLAKSQELFLKAASQTPDQRDQLLLKGLATLSEVNIHAVETENGLMANDPDHMVLAGTKAAHLSKATFDLFPKDNGEDEVMELMVELLEEYIHYQAGFADYARLVKLQRDDSQEFVRQFDNGVKELEKHLEFLEGITYSEVNACLLNLHAIHALVGKPRIEIRSSHHLLSITLYVGADFANHILNTMVGKSPEEISEELFGGEMGVELAGLAQLDDFLETNIGASQAESLQILVGSATLQLFDKPFEFSVELRIRRFGTCNILFKFDLTDTPLTVSDLRAIQTLVGPQTGTNQISFQGQNFDRLVDVVTFIDRLLLRYHKGWAKTTLTLKDFFMDGVPHEHERTWYSRTVLLDVGILDQNGSYQRVVDYHTLETSPEFKGLVLPLYEGRSALDDWVQRPAKQWDNLAEIRAHECDLIYATSHTMTVFMPDDPQWVVEGVLNCAELMTEINCLILAFDQMAENVRSRLIKRVQEAKRSLELVQPGQIQTTVAEIRRRSIETTEFELLAMQAIQLLQSQGTLRYFDHAEFMRALVEKVDVEPVVANLERKLVMIKESQEGIVQTSEALLNKYEQRVSESRERVVKAGTAIFAGFAQLSLLDTIISNLGLSGDLADLFRTGSVVLAVAAAALVILWLAWTYRRETKQIYDEKNES